MHYGYSALLITTNNDVEVKNCLKRSSNTYLGEAKGRGGEGRVYAMVIGIKYW